MLDPNGTPRQIPADQKYAALKAGGKVAVKMLDPKGTARWVPDDQREAALSAGGKLAPESPVTAPSAPASPLITSGEGQYQMKDKSGNVVPVSYGHVLDAIHNGHVFTDRKVLAQFARDHADDPNNARNRSDAAQKAMSDWNPLKYLAAIGAGPLDVLQGIGGEVAKTVTAFDKPATSEAETNLQLAAETPAHGFNQQVGAGGEQIGELAVAPETDITKAAKVGKIAKTALKVGEQGLRAAGEQGAQTYVKTSGDTEEAKRAAETGGVVGAATPLGGAALAKLGEFGKDVGRFFLKVGDMQTGTMVRETEKANEDIAKKAEEVRAANAEKVAQAEKDHADAVEKAKAAHDAKVKAATAPTENAQATNEFKDQQAQLDHEHAVEKARLAHEQAVADQQEIDAKAEVANRHLLETRGRLFTRLQTIKDAAQNFFKKNYAEVENIVNRTDENGQPHIDDDNSVPMTDLADAIDDARKHLQGSDESIKVFKDIENKAGVYAVDVDKPPTAKQDVVNGKGYSESAWSTKSPKERAEIWDEIKDAWPEDAQRVGFSHLKGYYSELGRMLASESVPGDVKQAVVALRNSIDDMQQKLANDAGVGSRYKLLRNQYRNYAKGFLDYHGSEGEASPVAKAVRKNDAANATDQFLKKEPEELSVIKKHLAGGGTADTQFVEGNIITPGGKPEPAWRYRRNTSKLLDNFIDADNKAEALAKQAGKPVGEFVPPEFKPAKPNMVPESKEVGEFKPPEAEPPKLDDVPGKNVKTPDDVRKLKEENLLNRASLLNHFGTYMALSGIVGATLAFTGGGSPEDRLRRAAEGVLVGAVSPYVMARIVERPDVIKALTTVTKKDLDRLMKLPADQRSGVEQGIKEIAEKAIEKGKLKAKDIPWLRIIAGSAAVKATKPASETTTPGESEQDIQKDLDQMQQTVPQ